MYDNKLVVAQMLAIQNKFNLSNEAFGQMIDVSGSYIGKVKKGRSLSPKKVEKMCEIWGVNKLDLLEDPNTHDIELHESIDHMMRARGISIYGMEKGTGIPALRVSQICRGKVEPTSEELRLICGVLNTQPEVITQGLVLRNFEIIRKALESLGLSDEVIGIHLEAIEKELK